MKSVDYNLYFCHRGDFVFFQGRNHSSGLQKKIYTYAFKWKKKFYKLQVFTWYKSNCSFYLQHSFDFDLTYLFVLLFKD